jgi:hypothetical protein
MARDTGALSAPGKQQAENGLVGRAPASLTVQGPRTGRAGGLRVMQEGGLTAIVGPSIQCQCAMAVEMRPFLRPNIGPMALAKVALCRLQESARAPGCLGPSESYFWGHS